MTTKGCKCSEDRLGSYDIAVPEDSTDASRQTDNIFLAFVCYKNKVVQGEMKLKCVFLVLSNTMVYFVNSTWKITTSF